MNLSLRKKVTQGIDGTTKERYVRNLNVHCVVLSDLILPYRSHVSTFLWKQQVKMSQTQAQAAMEVEDMDIVHQAISLHNEGASLQFVESAFQQIMGDVTDMLYDDTVLAILNTLKHYPRKKLPTYDALIRAVILLQKICYRAYKDVTVIDRCHPGEDGVPVTDEMKHIVITKIRKARVLELVEGFYGGVTFHPQVEEINTEGIRAVAALRRGALNSNNIPVLNDGHAGNYLDVLQSQLPLSRHGYNEVNAHQMAVAHASMPDPNNSIQNEFGMIEHYRKIPTQSNSQTRRVRNRMFPKFNVTHPSFRWSSPDSNGPATIPAQRKRARTKKQRRGRK
jgi:hypothetical protein